ncbi:hypothetical protein BKA70DRAFT_1436279 [Coprinopsis sp. MPI-PUGE-AT-0042]|nr:hypothetical protein BKA70DRAFT_1436279 [Coprinopsis sp. MPI-PUGE-AT-0042]
MAREYQQPWATDAAHWKLRIGEMNKPHPLKFTISSTKNKTAPKALTCEVQDESSEESQDASLLSWTDPIPLSSTWSELERWAGICAGTASSTSTVEKGRRRWVDQFELVKAVQERLAMIRASMPTRTLRTAALAGGAFEDSVVALSCFVGTEESVGWLQGS